MSDSTFSLDTTSFLASSQDVVAVPRAPLPLAASRRPSMAKKRPAANSLALPLPIIETSLVPPALRVPSSLSHSLESATDSSSDDDSLTDSIKRSRHDSAVSVLSDESDSQSSISSITSEFSCSSSSLDSACGRHLVGGKHNQRIEPLINDSIVGEFKVVGAGREAKAVHMSTNEIFDCRVLSDSEAMAVSKIVCRLDDARSFYHGRDIDELRDQVFPSKSQVVEEMSGRLVMFSPVYQKTLHSFAQERGVHITEAEVKPIFEQIIRLVSFCHSLGIIVRDLKPKKLVIEKSGTIRLAHVCDCVVCDDPEDDMVREKFGSPAYVPPEVLSACGRGYSGKSADMWGLGVLLYLLLLGRYPFYDQTPVGVFQKIKQARVVIPPASLISRHARILLFNLLRKAPHERPSAEELRFVPWATATRSLPSRGATERTITMSMAQELFGELSSAGFVSERRPAVSSNLMELEEPRLPARRSLTNVGEGQRALDSLRNIMMSTRHFLVAARAAMGNPAPV